MTKHDTLNKKSSNSQLNRLKLGIKNGPEVTLKILSNAVGDFDDEKNFLHKLLLTLMQKFQSFVKLLQIILQLI